jgi:hypothetical protein
MSDTYKTLKVEDSGEQHNFPTQATTLGDLDTPGFRSHFSISDRAQLTVNGEQKTTAYILQDGDIIGSLVGASSKSK